MQDEQEDTPWGVLTTDADGTIRSTNLRFAAWTGKSRDDLRDKVRWKELLTPASRILYETHFVPRLEAQGAATEVALELSRPDGTRFPILACAIRRRASDAVVITVFDATETRRFEQALRDARREAESAADALFDANKMLHAQHEQLRFTLRSIADAVVTTDSNSSITSMNPKAEQIAGVLSVDAIGQPVASLGKLLDPRTRLPVPDEQLMAMRPTERGWGLLFIRRDGTQRYVNGTVGEITDESGQGNGRVFVWRDVTEARATALQLAHDASHDHLTGLYNRREFERRITAASAAAASPGVSDVLLYIDLDQFKIINDTAGHGAGDQALMAVARLFRDTLRQADVLGRLGGDEFGVLLQHCSTESGAQIAEDLREKLQAMRFVWGDRLYAMTASIGMATLDRGQGTAAGTLAAADMACNAAKEAGRNRVHSFELHAERLRHRRDEMAWVSRIRRGLDEDRFVLHYQPIVRVDGQPEQRRHGELLLRLRDDDGVILSPGDFIGAAERYHQMGHVDRWVVRKAFDWLDATPEVAVSINVSGQSFGDATFLAFVIDQLDQHAFEPARVCIEITETAAIADLASALNFIRQLRQRGILFALDDFGAGLSSFAYLRKLQVDFVKIDGSFVKSMATDPVNREIVESIHRIARQCKLRTVAEWVEDDSVLTALRAIGIDHAQGWHTGRPVAIELPTPQAAPVSTDRVDPSPARLLAGRGTFTLERT